MRKKFCTLLLVICSLLSGCENPWVKKITDPLIKKKMVYVIGDTGPGGGLIFYVNPNGFVMTDTGKKANYLEAAPASTEGLLAISPDWGNNGPAGTSESLGTGRQNTLLMIAAAPAPAAEYCYNLTFGGKNDWFLPSYDELYLMYMNLHANNNPLSDFLNSYYYSSSVTNSLGNGISLNFSTGNRYDGDWFSTSNYVRPIRAF